MTVVVSINPMRLRRREQPNWRAALEVDRAVDHRQQVLVEGPSWASLIEVLSPVWSPEQVDA